MLEQVTTYLNNLIHAGEKLVFGKLSFPLSNLEKE